MNTATSIGVFVLSTIIILACVFCGFLFGKKQIIKEEIVGLTKVIEYQAQTLKQVREKADLLQELNAQQTYMIVSGCN